MKQACLLNLFYFNLHHNLTDMKKKSKKESKLVALSLRLPEPLYNKLQERAGSQKRSINKESQMIFEKEFN